MPSTMGARVCQDELHHLQKEQRQILKLFTNNELDAEGHQEEALPHGKIGHLREHQGAMLEVMDLAELVQVVNLWLGIAIMKAGVSRGSEGAPPTSEGVAVGFLVVRWSVPL